MVRFGSLELDRAATKPSADDGVRVTRATRLKSMPSRLLSNQSVGPATGCGDSSMSQVCRYANRVSYEVLVQASPRLTRGLPQREEGLDDEAYWAG